MSPEEEAMFPAPVLTLLAAQHGVATWPQLNARGLSRRALERAVDSGAVEVLHERAFRILSSPLTLEARCAALSLAYPKGFVTGPAWGRLHGIRRMPTTESIDFVIAHGSHVGPFEGVRLRQSRSIAPWHSRVRGDSIRVAHAARAAFDLASDLGPLDLQSVIEQIVQQRLTDRSTLARIARDLARPARPGSVQFVRALLTPRGGGAAESHAEAALAAALRARGLPLVAQFGEIEVPSGRRYRPDLSLPDIRWAIELDLHPDHLLLQGTTSDKRRDREFHMAGWQVERVTEIDLLDLPRLVEELLDLARARSVTMGGRHHLTV